MDLPTALHSTPFSTPAGSPIPDDSPTAVSPASDDEESDEDIASPSNSPRGNPLEFLSYEAFTDFCQSSEQRADLAGFLQHYGLDSLRELLDAWWSIQQTETYLECEHLWLAYIAGAAQRLYHGINGLIPFATTNDRNLSTTALADFSSQCTTIGRFANSSVSRLPEYVRHSRRCRRIIFHQLEVLRLAHHARIIFTKYGYLPEQPRRVYNEDEPEDWIAPDPTHIDTTWVDPQSDDYVSPTQVNAGPLD
jgi:hypothetical protein